MNVYGHFGLQASPFSADADQNLFYGGAAHQEALATLRYAVATRRACVGVVGDSGLGKTFLARRLAGLIAGKRPVLWVQGANQPDNILQAQWVPAAVFQGARADLPTMQPLSLLLEELIVRGRHPVVIIDDAEELLDDHWVELIGVMTQELRPTPMSTLVLLGGPDLRERITRPELTRIRRRIFRMCPLRELSLAEVGEYLECRVAALGGSAERVFDNEAIEHIASITRGSPALINQLGDNALIEACSAEHEQVTGQDVLMAVYAMLGISGGKPDALRLPATKEVDGPQATSDSSTQASDGSTECDEPTAAVSKEEPSVMPTFDPQPKPEPETVDFEARMRKLQARMRDAMSAVREAAHEDDEDIIDAEVEMTSAQSDG